MCSRLADFMCGKSSYDNEAEQKEKIVVVPASSKYLGTNKVYRTTGCLYIRKQNSILQKLFYNSLQAS